jgi:hypothetical protein
LTVLRSFTDPTEAANYARDYLGATSAAELERLIADLSPEQREAARMHPEAFFEAYADEMQRIAATRASTVNAANQNEENHHD